MTTVNRGCHRAWLGAAVFGLGIVAGWAWAQQPDPRGPRLELVTEASVWREQVARLQAQFDRVQELNRKGAVGGENESLALVTQRLLMAKAELALAQGQRDEYKTLLGEAALAAHRNIDACQSAALTNRVPLERLLEAFQDATNADLKLAALGKQPDAGAKSSSE